MTCSITYTYILFCSVHMFVPGDPFCMFGASQKEWTFFAAMNRLRMWDATTKEMKHLSDKKKIEKRAFLGSLMMRCSETRSFSPEKCMLY